MKKFYIIFENATGYALFHIIANEEIGALLDVVQESVSTLDRFGKVVKLVAFMPFANSEKCIENCLAISDGVLHNDLKEFILANVGSKLKKVRIGVIDPKLALAIHEQMDIKCEYGDAIFEIFRGIRLHFCKMVEGLSEKVAITAQAGLGHSYSRNKVKFNVNKADNMIIQSSALIEQLEKDINLFSMRIREWYSYHYPELYKLVNNNQKFIKLVDLIGKRTEFDVEKYDDLLKIVEEESVAQEIVNSLRMSMGTDINDVDLMNIKIFSKKVLSMCEYKNQLTDYLSNKMNSIAPNLTAIVGEGVGAKLISQAGSLVNLVKCPASTLQILGAEKALFRAIKTRGKTPKYGLIYHSSFISKAPQNCKGRISRLLAHKCSLASRIDYFQENPTDAFGKVLSDQIDERLKYVTNPEGLTLPRSNEEVMKIAVSEFEKSNQSRKRKMSFEEVVDEVVDEVVTKDKKKLKKKKKNKNVETPV